MDTLARKYLENGAKFALKHADDAKTSYDWKGDICLYVFNDGSKIEFKLFI